MQFPQRSRRGRRTEPPNARGVRRENCEDEHSSSRGDRPERVNAPGFYRVLSAGVYRPVRARSFSTHHAGLAEGHRGVTRTIGVDALGRPGRGEEHRQSTEDGILPVLL